MISVRLISLVICLVMNLHYSPNIVSISATTLNSSSTNTGNGSNLSFPSTGTWLGDLLIAIGVSGAGAATITAFANHLMKRREEELEISKYKIEGISNSKPYILQWARRNKSFFSQLKKGRKELNSETCFYYICDILYLRSKIYQDFGFQLDNIQAEIVLHGFGEYLPTSLVTKSAKLDESDISRMTNFGKSNLSYDDFIRKTIPANQNLHLRFKEWLTEMSEVDYQTLAINSRNFGELLIFEVNHIYKIWYKKEPTAKDFISNHTYRHLKEHYPDYHKRINSFNRTF